MRRILLGTAVGLATLAAVSAAQASPTFTSGSFAFTAFTSTTTDVTTTKIFTITGGTLTPGSALGDFTMLSPPATLSVTSPLDFATGMILDFKFSDPVFGTFDPTGGSVTSLGTHSGVSASAAFNVTGNFILGSGWANAGAKLSANETWALTQTGGPGNAISLSGTFNSPAVPVGVPEPATIAIMGVGAALAGMRLQRKK
jgi:hypothetical protein